MSEELFNVCQFFIDGTYEYACRPAWRAGSRLMRRGTTPTMPAACGCGLERVIITDTGDSCVFEWKLGEGVTFPPEAKGKM